MVDTSNSNGEMTEEEFQEWIEQSIKNNFETDVGHDESKGSFSLEGEAIDPFAETE